MKTVSESAPETIEVGARVRFKGDHSSNPLWMTVTRRDVNPPGSNNQQIAGTFLQLMWPYSTEHAGMAGPGSGAGDYALDDVRSVQSVMEAAVTTKPMKDPLQAAQERPTMRRAR